MTRRSTTTTTTTVGPRAKATWTRLRRTETRRPRHQPQSSGRAADRTPAETDDDSDASAEELFSAPKAPAAAAATPPPAISATSSNLRSSSAASSRRQREQQASDLSESVPAPDPNAIFFPGAPVDAPLHLSLLERESFLECGAQKLAVHITLDRRTEDVSVVAAARPHAPVDAIRIASVNIARTCDERELFGLKEIVADGCAFSFALTDEYMTRRTPRLNVVARFLPEEAGDPWWCSHLHFLMHPDTNRPNFSSARLYERGETLFFQMQEEYKEHLPSMGEILPVYRAKIDKIRRASIRYENRKDLAQLNDKSA
jgi:hypothetical protein